MNMKKSLTLGLAMVKATVLVALLLTGGHSAIDRKKRVEKAQQELRRALPLWSDPDFDAYAARHYQAYWLKVDLAQKIRHFHLPG